LLWQFLASQDFINASISYLKLIRLQLISIKHFYQKLRDCAKNTLIEQSRSVQAPSTAHSIRNPQGSAKSAILTNSKVTLLALLLGVEKLALGLDPGRVEFVSCLVPPPEPEPLPEFDPELESVPEPEPEVLPDPVLPSEPDPDELPLPEPDP
jgi:hypothetical protein